MASSRRAVYHDCRLMPIAPEGRAEEHGRLHVSGGARASTATEIGSAARRPPVVRHPSTSSGCKAHHRRARDAGEGRGDCFAALAMIGKD